MKNRKIILIILASHMCCTSGQDMFRARQLTDDNAQQGFATWSPDGNSIVHQYMDLNDTMDRNGLWKITLNEKGRQTSKELIFSGIAEHPRWSPNGGYIVFDADTGQSIRMIPAEGGDPVAFLPDTVSIYNGGLPCWSPDASQIAFKDASYRLCAYDMNSGELRELYEKEGMIVLPGCWTKDGQYILFALMDRVSRVSTMWKISADGSEITQLTGHLDNFYRYITLSPDGSLLAYATMGERFLGIYVMPSGGGISVPLAVSRRGHNESPCWSPDGKWMTFTSTRRGSFDIWIMDAEVERIKNKLGI